MSSSAVADDVIDMRAGREPMNEARLDRALDHLAEHCEVIGRVTAASEERRPQARAQLERELGPELTRTLLAGLAARR
jgi:hypothetical protein